MAPDPTRTNAGPWLDLQGVEAWINGTRVFENLSLQLWLGQHTAILGPNGSGKSSLVKLISRALYPVVRPGSHLTLFGEQTINLWQLRRQLGVVSSELEPRIPVALASRDLLLAAFFGAVGLGRDQRPNAMQRERVDQMLQQLDLVQQADQPYGSLSDGQKRRLQIGRALVHCPEVLVLDEPTNALDLKARHTLLALLRKLCAQNTTLVLITHQVDAILPDISRVVGLSHGQVALDDHPERALRDQPLSSLFQPPLRVVEANGYRQVLPA